MSISNRITRTALLLALALAVQQFKIQWLTGPAINAILILTIAYVDIYSAATIGLITPVLALVNGIMPLAIVAPFIMISNVVYVIFFNWQFRKNIFVAISLAAIAKFIVLGFAVNFIIDVPTKVGYMLSTPQLFTAVTGGIIASIIIKYLPLENAATKSNK